MKTSTATNIPCFLIALCLTPGLAWGDPSTEFQYQDLSEAIEAQGGSAQLYLKRARLALSHGDAQSALKDLSAAEAQGASLSDIHLRRGEAYLILEDWPKAEAAFRACLTQEPGHVAALMGQARALEAQGKWHDASQAWKRAVTLAKVPAPDPYLSWAKALAHLGDEGKVEAIAALATAQEALGPLPTFEVYALELELALGESEAALARLGALIAGATRPEAFLVQRAQLLEAGGDSQGALTDYARALAAIEGLPPARRGNAQLMGLEAQCRSSLTRLSSISDPSTGD